jgi:predicted ATPase
LLDNGSRIVTITGPGGTGKTRLALEVAAQFVGQTADGVYWIPLASVPDAELVIPEIAAILGAGDDLGAFLRGRHILLLVDNLEHVLDAAAPLAELLSRAERLSLLVTSRASLRVSGEREYPLEPLAPRDSVTLFCERARGVGRELTPDETIDRICRRLDGLPLAIELAAARTKLLGPESLLERLDQALPVLTTGARDAPRRQRTLQATIEWSHDLLEATAQRVFARLSVFAGSFTLEAAEEVCDADVDALASLVDLSLVKAIADGRFLMLETIREYAGTLFGNLPDATEVRHRHAAFYAALAERCYAGRLNDEAGSAAALDVDHDNMRAALDSPDVSSETKLALCGALGWFWVTHSHLDEGAARIARALAAPHSASTDSARALTAAGRIAGALGRFDDSDDLFARALGQWEELRDDPELAAALETLGWAHFFRGDNEASLRAFERALEIRRRLGDETPALAGVCQVLVAEGDLDEAERLSRHLLELSRANGDLRSEHFAVHFLADCALMRGDYAEAEERYRESLTAARNLGDVVETSLEVQGVAMAAAGAGDVARAVRLAASVEALWEFLGVAIDVAFWSALLEQHIGMARRALGPEGDLVWAEGRELPFEDAIDQAATPTTIK